LYETAKKILEDENKKALSTKLKKAEEREKKKKERDEKKKEEDRRKVKEGVIIETAKSKEVHTYYTTQILPQVWQPDVESIRTIAFYIMDFKDEEVDSVKTLDDAKKLTSAIQEHERNFEQLHMFNAIRKERLSQSYWTCLKNLE